MKFRLYRIMNHKEGIVSELAFESDSIQKAQRSALRRAKKAGIIPDMKHNAHYGTLGWISKGCNTYVRGLVYGDRHKATSIDLYLEVIDTKTDEVSDTCQAIGKQVKSTYKPNPERAEMEVCMYNHVDRRSKVYKDWMRGKISLSEAYAIATQI